MSRSDNAHPPHGGWPVHRPAGEHDPADWTQGLNGAPRPNPQISPQSQAYQRPVHPPAAHPDAGYRGAPQHADGFGHQGQDYYYGHNTPQGAVHPAPRPAPAAQGVAPPYPQHAPQQASPPLQSGAYGYQPPYGEQAQPAGYPAGHGYGNDPGQAALRPAHQDQWGAAPASTDPRSFDLSSYMPPPTRTAPPLQPQQPQHQDLGHQDLGPQNLGAQNLGYAQGQSYGGARNQQADYGQQYSDWGHQAGYAQQPGLPGNHGGQYGTPDGYAADPYQAAEGDPHADGYEDDGYGYEEPPKRNKYLMMAGAFAGALVVAVGLTWAYQTVLGPAADGPTPIVKKADGPLKVKPDKPDGKQFAHSDSKLLGRLGDGGSSSETDGSARKVSTLVVGRDGSIQAPAAPAVSVPVPGMTIVDVNDPAPPVTSQVAPAAPQGTITVAPPASVQPAPVKPVELARADGPPATTQAVVPLAINVPEAAPPAPPAPPAAPVAKVKPPVQTAATEPAVRAPQPTGPAPTGAGYVAVLASLPASSSSRLDALKQFADMQQRYGDVLMSKTPDVQEANLGEKGRYHRLLVGPPGSKDAANTVCAQLKNAGHTNCWIMAY